jgi:NRAMP (natural resistance-associated macrophage protein)-like metal ion transporter
MPKLKTRLAKWFKVIGPGFITGAADDDPSGIATYSQTGAMFGYNQLWLAFVSTPFMTVVQEMCGRIGMVKGRGLAAVIRERYGKGILGLAVVALLIANTINIGADLGAMAATMAMLLGGNFVIWMLFITAGILALEIFVSYKSYAKYLKYLTLSLLAYVVTAFVATHDWGNVLRTTVMPQLSMNKEYFINIVAILGTTISPYLFFWQASEEVEEEIADHKLQEMGAGEVPVVHKKDLKHMRVDTIVGMVFSNLMFFFIVVTTAATLGAHGIREVATAAQAAEALRPFAGNFSYLLFTLGILGTGLLAVPILAGSASYAVAESLGWRSGLYRRFKDAHGFYGVITIATIIGLAVNFTALTPFQMLYYAAVVNGLLAPVLLVIIVMLASDRKVMGRHANGPFAKWMGWLTVVLMGGCGVALLYYTYLA